MFLKFCSKNSKFSKNDIFSKSFGKFVRSVKNCRFSSSLEQSYIVRFFSFLLKKTDISYFSEQSDSFVLRSSFFFLKDILFHEKFRSFSRMLFFQKTIRSRRRVCVEKPAGNEVVYYWKIFQLSLQKYQME